MADKPPAIVRPSTLTRTRIRIPLKGHREVLLEGPSDMDADDVLSVLWALSDAYIKVRSGQVPSVADPHSRLLVPQ